MAKYSPIDGLTTGFNFVLRDKARRKRTTLAPKLGLGLPTLCCPSNPYGSNSKSCVVHRFDVLVPVPVFFLGRLSEDVATRLSSCYLISLTEAAHRYLDALCNEARHVRNKSFEFGVYGKNGGGGGWVGWVRVLITKFAGSLTCFLCSSRYSSSFPCFYNRDLSRWNCFEISDFQTDLKSEH